MSWLDEAKAIVKSKEATTIAIIEKADMAISIYRHI